MDDVVDEGDTIDRDRAQPDLSEMVEQEPVDGDVPGRPPNTDERPEPRRGTRGAAGEIGRINTVQRVSGPDLAGVGGRQAERRRPEIAAIGLLHRIGQRACSGRPGYRPS